MRIKHCIFILFVSVKLYSQTNIHEFELQTGMTAGFGDTLPFWLFSNQYSLMRKDPFNIYATTGYKKQISETKKFDFSGGLTLVNLYNKSYDIFLDEAFGKIKLSSLILQAGKTREIFGNHDTLLSSGGLLWSGNAKAIPSVAIYSQDFISLPLTHKLLSLKAGMYHGWLGDNQFIKNAFLHHKYVYLKAGGDFPVSLAFGLHHYAQWAGTSSDTLIGRLPHDLNEFTRIFLAAEGGESSPGNEQINATGNHLGSYNVRIDANLHRVNIGLYWQSIFEDNSGRKNQNLWDGLYGISLNMKKDSPVKRILLELLSTTNQSGKPEYDPSDPRPPLWNDNYFNNWLYKMGWSYQNMTIGNPFITSPILSADKNDFEYFNNNRVKLLHAGFSGKIYSAEYTLLFSRSKNYGTYYFPFSPARDQTSVLINVLIPRLVMKTDFSVSMGFDRGKMYGNNTGFLVKLIKKMTI